MNIKAIALAVSAIALGAAPALADETLRSDIAADYDSHLGALFTYFHTHPELEEMIYVLAGEVEQWVEKEKRILKPGDAAHIPAGVVHATFNVSKSDATILAILSPGASQGPFMVDVSGESPWKDLRAGA